MQVIRGYSLCPHGDATAIDLDQAGILHALKFTNERLRRLSGILPDITRGLAGNLPEIVQIVGVDGPVVLALGCGSGVGRGANALASRAKGRER